MNGLIVYNLIVTLHVKPEFRDEFLKAVEEDGRGSIRDEPGCLRFDIIESNDDPNLLFYYEVYRDRAAFETHGQMPHFLKYRETTKDWLAAPTEARHGHSLFPPDAVWIKQPTP